MKTLWLIFYLNCIKYFSIRRFIITVPILFIYFLLMIVVLSFRLLDEVIYPGYRKIKIQKPVFIISNPRSGTTFLHRLLCMDEKRFTYTLLYQTIMPAISLYKLVNFLGKVDGKIGRPMRRTFDWLDEALFGGWKDIHPMGFNRSEEDEGMYIFSLLTAGIFLLCPFIKELQYIKFQDDLKDSDRNAIAKFYENTLKRLMYTTENNTIYLSKNVLSTGRIRSLLQSFPDARIIYLLRHPYKSVPSLTSMFKTPWKIHSPDIPDNSPQARELGWMAVDFYEYFYKEKNEINPKNLVTIRYEDLVEEPFEAVKKIYHHFGMEMSEGFQEKLRMRSKRSKTYKSTHTYTLAQYGFEKKEIYTRLKPLFSEFNFQE